MNSKKIISMALATVAALSLCLPAFAASSRQVSGCVEFDDNSISVHAQGPGVYDLGNGKAVTIEPIPENELSTSESPHAASPVLDTMPMNDGEPDENAVVVYVKGEGEYDLGNGMTLVVEPIPEEDMSEPGIQPYLYESNDNLPLTGAWHWFCSDRPILPTTLKIYNHSKRNPGNLNAHVFQNIAYPLDQVHLYIYDIEPGYMGKIEEIISDYSVELSASVQGHYNVVVNDWP